MRRESTTCEGLGSLSPLRAFRDGTLSEQVKAYSGRLGIADQAVVEILRQFLRSYFTLRRQGETRRFLFECCLANGRIRSLGTTCWEKAIVRSTRC